MRFAGGLREALREGDAAQRELQRAAARSQQARGGDSAARAEATAPAQPGQARRAHQYYGHAEALFRPASAVVIVFIALAVWLCAAALSVGCSSFHSYLFHASGYVRVGVSSSSFYVPLCLSEQSCIHSHSSRHAACYVIVQVAPAIAACLVARSFLYVHPAS